MSERAMASLERAAAERIVVLDGAMGTMIQALRPTEEDFRGSRFADHPVRISVRAVDASRRQSEAWTEVAVERDRAPVNPAGRVEYETTLASMRQFTSARERATSSQIWLLEHEAVLDDRLKIDPAPPHNTITLQVWTLFHNPRQFV